MGLTAVEGLRDLPVHLLHLGYPTTGSRSLQRWFGSLGQVGFRDGHMAGFRGVWSFLDGLRLGVDPQRPVVTSLGLLSTPTRRDRKFDSQRGAQVLSSPAARRRVARVLHSLFPEAQVLIVTRGYAELLRAMHGEAVRNGARISLTEFAMLQAELQRRGVSCLDYDRVIGEFRSIFGAERVTVLPVELLLAEPQVFAARIAAVLGIETPIVPIPAIAAAPLAPTNGELMLERLLARCTAVLPVARSVREQLRDLHFIWARCIVRLNPAAILGRYRSRAILVQAASEVIPAAALAAFRGCAADLCRLPPYAPFCRDYLCDE